MDFLHNPWMMAVHYTCMAAMVGASLDPTGIGATVSNLVGHFTGGLGNIFSAATGGSLAAGATAGATTQAAAHAGHAVAAAAAAPVPPPLSPDISSFASPVIQTDIPMNGDFAAAASAATGIDPEMAELANAYGMSIDEYMTLICE